MSNSHYIHNFHDPNRVLLSENDFEDFVHVKHLPWVSTLILKEISSRNKLLIPYLDPLNFADFDYSVFQRILFI